MKQSSLGTVVGSLSGVVDNVCRDGNRRNEAAVWQSSGHLLFEDLTNDAGTVERAVVVDVDTLVP